MPAAYARRAAQRQRQRQRRAQKKRRQQIFRLVAPNSNHKWMLYLPVVVVLVVGTSKVVCLALLLLLSVRLTVNNRKTRARI